MTRPKEMDMLHFYYLHPNLHHLVRISNVNNESNIYDKKNNTDIYVKAFESWVTRISIAVDSACLTDPTIPRNSNCFIAML